MQKQENACKLGTFRKASYGGVLVEAILLINTLFLQNWGFYEFTFFQDGPCFFKVHAL